jgi:DNA helicase-2/ATP-dependent DNA helicase PcrA
MSTRAVKVLTRFANMLSNWINLKEKIQPLALMDRILEDVDYQTYIDDGSDEGHSRWENVLELRRLAAEYQEEGLGAFLEQVALVSDQDTLDADANVPTLLTLHAAKGLEFPTVFIAGLNDGTLPHSRSFDDPEAMMEERRLLYVGITRAKDRLYLLYSQNRSSYGYSEPAEPSRFLTDIPDKQLTGAHFGWRRSDIQSQKRINQKTYNGATRWEDGSHRRVLEESLDEQIPAQKYHPGMRVKHSKWGEGMVLNSRLQDDDEIVDIFFEDLGLKKVAASLAPLIKL